MKQILASLVLAVVIFSSKASAMDWSSYYFAADFSAGYGNTNNVASSQTAPTLIIYGLGLVGAYKFNDTWSAGLSTDYYMINQTNDPGTSGTNYSGNWATLLSPTLGYKNWGWTFLADYKLLGSWALSKSTASGQTSNYQSPSGLRLRGWTPVSWVKGMTLGAQGEYVNFTTLAASTNTTVNQMLWQVGGVLGYEF